MISKPGARLIAIVGGSCTGKTTLAHALEQGLPGAVVIGEDDYYICSSAVPGFDAAAYNFDVPEAKDHALLLQHQRMARAGEAFDKPLYDFATHRRRGETEHVAPARYVIVEGMHVLVSPELRALFDFSIYLDTDKATRLSRRMQRDIAARQRTPDSIARQFDLHVEPMQALYVAPQKDYANTVLTEAPDAATIGALLDRIRKLA